MEPILFRRREADRAPRDPAGRPAILSRSRPEHLLQHEAEVAIVVAGTQLTWMSTVFATPGAFHQVEEHLRRRVPIGTGAPAVNGRKQSVLPDMHMGIEVFDTAYQSPPWRPPLVRNIARRVRDGIKFRGTT